MLACNNIKGVIAQPGVEQEICGYVSTGREYLIGFMATGTYSAEFRLYVGEECYYVYKTSPGNRTAYVADRSFRVPAGVKVSLRAYHNDNGSQEFKGTILGGE